MGKHFFIGEKVTTPSGKGSISSILSNDKYLVKLDDSEYSVICKSDFIILGQTKTSYSGVSDILIKALENKNVTFYNK